MSTLPVASLSVIECPLCYLAALGGRAGTVDHAITCTHCGAFIVTDAARVMLSALPTRMHIALTRAAHHCAAQGRTMHITVQNLAQLVAPFL